MQIKRFKKNKDETSYNKYTQEEHILENANDIDFQQQNMLTHGDEIKPLISKKTKRNKKLMTALVLLSLASVGGVFAYAQKLSTQKIGFKKEEITKIENTSPKKFNTLPPVSNSVASQTEVNASSATTAIVSNNEPYYNALSAPLPPQDNKTSLYDAGLCNGCDASGSENNQSHNAFNTQNATEDLLPIAQANTKNRNNASNENNNFKDLEASKLKGSFATTIKKPELTITKGAFLDAILETQIDSSLSGMVSAILAHDVYSVNGKVLLLEKGSKIVGEYAKGIKEGTERLFVVWGRISTPDGVMIDLDSLGTDNLGGSGFNGQINHQYGKRFGSALLLSMIGDSLSALSKKSQVTNNINNTQEQVSSMAEQALSNAINIPPILYKNQGEHINIFVSRDLDFTGVYKLKLQPNINNNG